MDFKAYRQKAGFVRFYLVIFGILGLAFFLGYELKQVEKSQLVDEHELMSNSLANLTQVHEALQSEYNMLKVELEIAQLANEKNQVDYKESIQREQDLREQVSFYQRVMAPELSQDGFVIERIQVTPTVSENNYSLNMILLQHESVKAVIKGELKVTLYGSDNGKVTSIDITELQETPKTSLNFAFKYFQVIQTSITLPENFIPDRFEINTSVYKYNKKRGDYKTSMKWDEAFIE